MQKLSALKKFTFAFLWTLLTSYSLVASAQTSASHSGPCDNPLTVLNTPRAISHDKVRSDSYTAYADEFMQIMWRAYISGGDPEEVQSEFFSRFIRQNLPELSRVHEYNRAHVIKDPKFSASAEILEQFETMDKYIANLEQRLDTGAHFTYAQMLQFSRVFVRAHDVEAYDKLKKLTDLPNAEQAIRQRYLKFSRAHALEVLNNESFGNHPSRREFLWKNYAQFAQYPSSSNFRFPELLQLPSLYITGSLAFYNTYHLPISPMILATEYEPQDYAILMSPSHNWSHEDGHWTNQSRLARWKEGEAESTRDLTKIQNDLTELKKLVNTESVAKNTPNLNKVFYYAFYYLKFERPRQGAFPRTIEGVQTAFEIEFSRLLKQNGHMSSLFLTLPEKLSPARTFKEFAELYAKVIYILSDYQAKTDQQRQENLESYESNLRLIAKNRL